MLTLNRILGVAVAKTTALRRRPPLLLQYRSSDATILLVVCAAVFTDIFLYGVLVPVLPFALARRVGIRQDQVAKWNGILLALFNLGLCLGSPVFGFLSDLTSARKLPFLAGLVTLTGATLLLCLSSTIALFSLGRFLQGVSGAICWSVGLSLLADTMKDRIGLALGWVNWAMNAGFLLSPILGGLAYGRAGYYSVYYMAFGLLACDIFLRLIMVEKKHAHVWQLNANGRVESAINAARTGPLSSSFENQREQVGIQSNAEVPTYQQRRHVVDIVEREESSDFGQASTQNPFLTLIKSRRVLAALLGCMMQSASKYALFAVIPTFVQGIFHWDSLAAGLIFLCLLLPGFSSPVVGTLCDRYGTRWLSCSGFFLSIPLFVCLRFVKEDTLKQKILFGSLLLLLGVALALSSTPLMAEIMYVIKDEDFKEPGIWGPTGVHGTGFGLFTTFFALGGVIGSFMGGYLFQISGWNTFGWAFAIWCAGGTIVCWLLVGSSTMESTK